MGCNPRTASRKNSWPRPTTRRSANSWGWACRFRKSPPRRDGVDFPGAGGWIAMDEPLDFDHGVTLRRIGRRQAGAFPRLLDHAPDALRGAIRRRRHGILSDEDGIAIARFPFRARVGD